MSIETIIKELEEEKKKQARIILAVECFLYNEIGHCKGEGCTEEKPCKGCIERNSLLDLIKSEI